MNPQEPQHVVVIGAGAIGTASAWYLRKAGWAVTLVDRDRQGRGATSGNCGLFSPSHALPLTVPGAVGVTLRSLFRRKTPLSIRPRLDFRLWAWLWRFARRCNERDMLAAAEGRHALITSSGELYRELREQEGLDIQWQDAGCLMVHKHARGLDAHGETAAILEERFGIEARRLDREELEEFEPALLPNATAGAWFYEGDAHMRPEALLAAWRNLLEKSGVEVRESCDVRTFVQNSQGEATAVLTNQGELKADAFVVATGAWTPKLKKELGASIPIQPGKGYSLTMPRPSLSPRHPLIFERERVVATPFKDGYRLGSTMEFAGYNTKLRPARLNVLKATAETYLREPHTTPIEQKWYGWRPMTPDGKPIVDRSPRLKNVLIAAGHNMLGLTMAPATGKLVAELLSETAPHLDPTAYSLARFSR